MDTQDHHKKNGSSGLENHEVHVCHKCGWPFPNPHPSAKYRRAHKKVCGTIEGYKLIESDAEHPHLDVSDDEHPSDDDRRTPSPKIDKRSVMELGSGGGVGEKSNKSEDELFSDAVMEFSDSGVSPGMEEHIRELNKDVEKLVNADLNNSQLLKVDATAGTSGQPNDPTWSSQTCNSEVIESARDQSETAKSLNDTEVEKSSVGSSGMIGLDASPVKFETLTDVLIEEINADVNRGTEKEPDINGNEDIEIDKALTDFIDPHVKAVRELSKQESSVEEMGKETSYALTQESVIPEADRERESELEATKGKSLDFVTLENVVHEPVTTDYVLQVGDGQTSDLLSTHKIIEQKKDENDELEANVPKNDVSSLVKPLEHMEDSVAVLAHAVDGSGQIKMVGVYDWREEGTEDLQSSSLKKDQEETRVSDVKEGNLNEAQKDNVHSLSLPESLPVMDNAVHMIEDFKDYNILKSSLPLDLGSAEVIRLAEGDYKATIVEEVHSGLRSGDLSGSIERSSADLNALKDDLDEKVGLEAPSDAPMTEAQNIQRYAISEGLHLHSSDSEPSQKAQSENATLELSDIKSAVFGEEVMQTTNINEDENADNNEMNTSEKSIIARKTSDLLSTDRIIEQKKDNIDELEANVAKNDVSSLVKPLEHMEDSVADFSHATDASGQSKMVGVSGWREEGKKDLQSSSLKKEQEETRVSDVKGGNLSETQMDNMHSFLVPQSLPVMDNAVHMIEEFKDYNILKSSLPLDLGSAEVIRLVEGDDKATIAEEVHSGLHSGDLSGSIESSSADLNALKHELNEKGVDKPIEGKADISGLIEESGEDRRSCGLEAQSDAPMTEAQNIQPHDLSEGLHFHSIDSEPLQRAHSENATMDQPDIKSAVFGEEVMQTTNLSGSENADNNEMNKSEKSVPAGKESSKELLEGELSADKKTNQEHAYTNETDKSEKSVTARKESSKELLEDELSANKKTNLELADSSFISEDNQPLGSLIVDRNEHHERAIVELLDTTRSESTEVGGGEISVTNTEATHESAGQTPKSTNLDMVPDKVVDPRRKMEQTYSSLDGCAAESFQEASQGFGSGNITDVAESIGSASKDIEVNHDGSLLASDENPEDSISKEVVPARVDHELLNKNSATVEVSPTREAIKNSSDCGSEPSRDEVDNKLGNQYDGVSAVNISVGSSGRADSLEGNWGSVSVVSAQSDTTTTTDAGGLLFADSQPPEKSEACMQMPKHATDESHPDKLDVFEPPSFMTLVESGNGVSQKVASSEIQTAHNNQQPKPDDLQAGWFPSISNVVNESQGRKKNEEIIAKVSNWSTGKHHAPLKDLLGEAKSPNSKQVSTVSQSDETATKSNGGAVTTVNAILHSEAPNDQAANKEMGKEWNSPARYPSEIKKEKRKGKPYWVPFVCCSSVHRDL